LACAVVMDVKCRRLEGKVAVVTASTQGIGLAIAERLGLEGAAVVISSRKQVQLSRQILSFLPSTLLVCCPRFGISLAARSDWGVSVDRFVGRCRRT